MTPREIIRFIEARQFPLSSEKRAQEALQAALEANGVAFEREVTLGDGDIIDFMIGNVGIEMKIKGQRLAIYRQCERYCAHDQVACIVLATNAAMGLPAEIKGKPAYLASLSRGWL